MSYMDRKNILSEGFFDLFKRLPKDVRDLKLTRSEKNLYKNNPKFKKALDSMIKNRKEIQAIFDKIK